MTRFVTVVIVVFAFVDVDLAVVCGVFRRVCSGVGGSVRSQVKRVLSEYKVHNCEVLVREDVSVDDIVDVVQGNRKWVHHIVASERESESRDLHMLDLMLLAD